MIPFEHFWQKTTFSLMQPRSIHHYTPDGKKNGQFQAQYKGGDYIFCTIENSKILQVPKKEFRVIYTKWDKYVSGSLSKTFLENESRFTKYTISIIQQYLHLNRTNLEERQ
jgi:predicted acetyltransferase